MKGHDVCESRLSGAEENCVCACVRMHVRVCACLGRQTEREGR